MFDWFKKKNNVVLPRPVTPFAGEAKNDGNNYFMQHRWGGTSKNFPLELLGEFYDELSSQDIEHVSVSLEHESAWSLGVYTSGAIVYENVEEGEPRHMNGLSKEQTISLWKKLAEGDLEAIEKEDWQDGYH